MDGGRTKWEQEGRPLIKEIPSYERTNYSAKDPNQILRLFGVKFSPI
jgi:thiosulfate/3-mercaptopyruvate sulfurtransferase